MRKESNVMKSNFVSRNLDRFCEELAKKTFAAVLLVCLLTIIGGLAVAQTPPVPPSVVDPDLMVRTVVTGLVQPTTMAFIGPDDMLVLEKASGKVQRVSGG